MITNPKAPGEPQDPSRRHTAFVVGAAPATPLGMALSAIFVAAFLVLTTVFIQVELALDRALVWSALFSLPTALLARRRHFGDHEWRLPSPGAICYHLWLVGLVPGLIEVGANPSAVAYFTSDAVAAGRVASLVWFVLFALALGPHRIEAKPTARPLTPPNVVAALATIVPIWAVSAAVASQSNMISRWGTKGDVATGSVQMAFVLLFDVLTPLIPALGALVALVGPRRLRLLGWGLMIVGISFVFLMSSRRLWIIAVVLAVLVVRHATSKVKPTHLALFGALVYMGAGPLQWAYRAAAMSDRDGDKIAVAADAILSFADDRDLRERSAEASSSNIQQRYDVVSPLFGATQYVLDEGANLSPSMLSGIIRLVPTFVYPDKNRVADSLEFERQLHRTGRFAWVDLGETPLTEFIFQFGVYIGVVGGIFYGLLGRLLNRTMASSAGDLAAFTLWACAYTAMLHFDAGTTNVFGHLREGVALAILCRAVQVTFLRGVSSRVGSSRETDGDSPQRRARS